MNQKRKINRKIRKYFELSENKNLSDPAKTIHSMKVPVIRKDDKSAISVSALKARKRTTN